MMSCRNKRRYYVLSKDEKTFYGYDQHGKPKMLINLPWLRPILFFTVGHARDIATENDAQVRYWPGRIYKNDPHNNYKAIDHVPVIRGLQSKKTEEKTHEKD